MKHLWFVFFLLGGCGTMIGHEKVAGWPALEIVENYVSNAQMRDRCVKYTGFGMSPIACAEFDFSNRKCYIWFSADFPPSRNVVEHERLHCGGYDHPGENTMAQILRRHYAVIGPERSAAAGGWGQGRN